MAVTVTVTVGVGAEPAGNGTSDDVAPVDGASRRAGGDEEESDPHPATTAAVRMRLTIGAVQAQVDQFGGLDVMVANAGIAITAPLVQTTVEKWWHTMAVNPDGASKFASAASRSRWPQSSEHQTTVNAYSPGIVETSMWHDIDADMTTRKGTPTGSELAGMTNAVPLDVAGVMSFLASPDAAYVTGQSLVVDGGTWFSLTRSPDECVRRPCRKLTMRLYLDTADRKAAEPLLATGLFAGVTTNPTILQRAGQGVDNIPDIYRWATAAGAGEVFFQSWGTDVDSLVARAERLLDLGSNVILKFVANQAGASACRVFAARGQQTLLTAIYHPGQAMIAAAAGATYIAPYLGRLNDEGRDGIAEVVTMQQVLTATGSATKVLLASIRSVSDMVTLAQHGVDCFTMAPAVAHDFFTDPTTAAAADTFEQAVRDTAREVLPG